MSLFQAAKEGWNDFLDSKIFLYSKYRNYDYGNKKDNYVSGLSPYITHRVLLEYDLIIDLKSKIKGSSINKFIEELYWRIYWKGWLENRPDLWKQFVFEKISMSNELSYKNAIRGETDLEFFNSWILELKNNNYLHNHTRMWFASTWIFNLKLPWQLGARLFLKHLYDGDAASNLLSWRWVAGLHTKGKKYLFTPENLKKFSNNRISVNTINNKEINLDENYDYPLKQDIYECDFKQKSENLILFENDLNLETLRQIIPNYKNVILILLTNKDRQIKLSSKVLDFKRRLCNEFLINFKNVELIDSNKIITKLSLYNQYDYIYSSVGENDDFINNIKIKYKILIHKLVRDEDLYSWQFAKKGFFKFKESIPLINKYILN